MNPTLKTVLTVLAGAILPGLDAATSNIQPTGGFAQALQSSQGYTLLFVGGTMLFHNLITTWEAKAGIHPAQQNPPAPK